MLCNALFLANVYRGFFGKNRRFTFCCTHTQKSHQYLSSTRLVNRQLITNCLESFTNFYAVGVDHMLVELNHSSSFLSYFFHRDEFVRHNAGQIKESSHDYTILRPLEL